jgi:hypothetical protein
VKRAAAAVTACAAAALAAAALSGAAGWAAAHASTTAVPLLVPQELMRPRPPLRPRGTLKQRYEVIRRRAWTRAFKAARRYARSRLGRVSFAIVDDQRRLHGYLDRRTFYSASLVKAMLLVAFLRRREIRHRPLSGASRAMLTPMIERSDNIAATKVRNIVGNASLARLARKAHMHHFATAVSWGDTALAAADQARYFRVIDRLVPPRHRGYARFLLAHVIQEQRWGIPQVAPHGARVYFKGGWRPSVGGWIVNQSALVEKGKRRVSLSILSDHDRSFGYGHETIRGVAARLLPVLATK